MKWALAVALAILAGSSFLAAPPTARADCSASTGALDCDLQARIVSTGAYLATRPGSVGYVLRDRRTGATYRNSHAGDLGWTACTIKLAVVVDQR